MWSAECQTHKTNLWRSYSATQLHTQNNNNKRFFSQSPFITFIYLREEKKIFHCNNDRDFFYRKRGKYLFFVLLLISFSFSLIFKFFRSRLFIYLFLSEVFGKFYLFFKKGVEEKNDFDSTSRFVKHKRKKKKKRIHDDFIWVYLCFAISVFFNTEKILGLLCKYGKFDWSVIYYYFI